MRSHEEINHTFAFEPGDLASHSGPRLVLEVIDAATGKFSPARFTVFADDLVFEPPALDDHGIRFKSIHQGKKQIQVITYARGTGPVIIPLPSGTRQIEVAVAKGLEYLPARNRKALVGEITAMKIPMKRWIDLERDGWIAAEEHVHYERLDPSLDPAWLTMLDADGLSAAHFMVLKGANFPGVWARQFGYGPRGEAFDGNRFVRPGEEYRDPFQGHINLLGVEKVIEPISTGGLGEPPVPYNYPPLHDVFLRAREIGGVGGVAHGAALGRSHTGVADTILGVVDFFEVANTHLYKLDVWYKLLNCGFIVPPMAGTDLPNFPFRDPWQPFLGSVRTYTKSGDKRDFAAWKSAVHRGEVFITSGPLIRFAANGIGPGGRIEVPESGGVIRVDAELASSQSLESFELIVNGKAVPAEVTKETDNEIQRWRIQHDLNISESSWIAVRGSGVPMVALDKMLGLNQRAIAHSAAIRVEVGGRSITSREGATTLIKQLAEQKEFYRVQGKYEKSQHRDHVIGLFDQAISKLKLQIGN